VLVDPTSDPAVAAPRWVQADNRGTIDDGDVGRPAFGIDVGSDPAVGRADVSALTMRATLLSGGSYVEAEIGKVRAMDSRPGRDGDDAPRSPREVFLRLVNGVCEGPYEDLAGLYAEQTHVTHPFHPHNPPPLRSRSELHEHFTAPPPVARTLNRKPVDITIHETADPEVIVAEFAYQGQVGETGEPFTVPCVFVMRIRDGLIVESRDYIDPIASARAWGRLDSLLTTLRPSADDDR